jgi:hypothetical protein
MLQPQAFGAVGNLTGTAPLMKRKEVKGNEANEMNEAKGSEFLLCSGSLMWLGVLVYGSRMWMVCTQQAPAGTL